MVKKEEELTSSQRSKLNLAVRILKVVSISNSIHVPRGVPVRSNIVKVKLEDRPEGVGHEGRIAISTEPVGVSNE